MSSVSPQRVRETVLTADRSAPEVFSLVVFEDGAWGVAKNGRPIPGNYWPASDAQECITAFMELSGLGAASGDGSGK